MLMFLILTYILPIAFIYLLKNLKKFHSFAIHLFFVVLKSQEATKLINSCCIVEKIYLIFKYDLKSENYSGFT